MSRTVTRAFDLLNAVINAQAPIGLMELSELTEVDKSTAQRLLAFLVDLDMLKRDDLTRRYELGPRSFAMAAAIGERSNLRGIAAPILRNLRDMTGESVSLHLPLAGSRVCVDGLESQHPIRRVIPLGETLPLHVGPSGKTILAHLPEPQIARLLKVSGLDKTGTRKIEKELQFIRNEGYLLTESDRTVGIRALSAPIFDARGVTASLTIAGPSTRWSEEDAMNCVPDLITSTNEISTQLGVRG